MKKKDNEFLEFYSILMFFDVFFYDIISKKNKMANILSFLNFLNKDVIDSPESKEKPESIYVKDYDYMKYELFNSDNKIIYILGFSDPELDKIYKSHTNDYKEIVLILIYDLIFQIKSNLKGITNKNDIVVQIYKPNQNEPQFGTDLIDLSIGADYWIKQFNEFKDNVKERRFLDFMYNELRILDLELESEKNIDKIKDFIVKIKGEVVDFLNSISIELIKFDINNVEYPDIYNLFFQLFNKFYIEKRKKVMNFIHHFMLISTLYAMNKVLCGYYTKFLINNGNFYQSILYKDGEIYINKDYINTNSRNLILFFDYSGDNIIFKKETYDKNIDVYYFKNEEISTLFAFIYKTAYMLSKNPQFSEQLKILERDRNLLKMWFHGIKENNYLRYLSLMNNLFDLLNYFQYKNSLNDNKTKLMNTLTGTFNVLFNSFLYDKYETAECNLFLDLIEFESEHGNWLKETSPEIKNKSLNVFKLLEEKKPEETKDKKEELKKEELKKEEPKKEEPKKEEPKKEEHKKEEPKKEEPKKEEPKKEEPKKEEHKKEEPKKEEPIIPKVPEKEYIKILKTSSDSCLLFEDDQIYEYVKYIKKGQYQIIENSLLTLFYFAFLQGIDKNKPVTFDAKLVILTFYSNNDVYNSLGEERRYFIEIINKMNDNNQISISLDLKDNSDKENLTQKMINMLYPLYGKMQDFFKSVDFSTRNDIESFKKRFEQNYSNMKSKNPKFIYEFHLFALALYIENMVKDKKIENLYKGNLYDCIYIDQKNNYLNPSKVDRDAIKDFDFLNYYPNHEVSLTIDCINLFKKLDEKGDYKKIQRCFFALMFKIFFLINEKKFVENQIFFTEIDKIENLIIDKKSISAIKLNQDGITTNFMKKVDISNNNTIENYLDTKLIQDFEIIFLLPLKDFIESLIKKTSEKKVDIENLLQEVFKYINGYINQNLRYKRNFIDTFFGYLFTKIRFSYWYYSVPETMAVSNNLPILKLDGTSYEYRREYERKILTINDKFKEINEIYKKEADSKDVNVLIKTLEKMKNIVDHVYEMYIKFIDSLYVKNEYEKCKMVYIDTQRKYENLLLKGFEEELIKIKNEKRIEKAKKTEEMDKEKYEEIKKKMEVILDKIKESKEKIHNFETEFQKLLDGQKI